MTQKIVPVIMAGGKGTRLWPLSRATAPKQFIQFVGDKTLFQETLERVSDPELYEAPIVVTNEEFRFLVAEQARERAIPLAAILLEPVARNTAAAVAAATIGLAGLMHIPKGKMFTMGIWSFMFAAGIYSVFSIFGGGRTASVLGAMPIVHIICAPMHTCNGINQPPIL